MTIPRFSTMTSTRPPKMRLQSVVAACVLLSHSSSAFTSHNFIHRTSLRTVPLNIPCRRSTLTPSQSRSHHHRTTELRSQSYYGDDLRWHKRLRRRFSFGGKNGTPNVCKILIASNILMFLYQTFDTVNYNRKRHPNVWPQQALSIILDTLLGSAQRGPLTRDFISSSSQTIMSFQPHRYITSAFLHGEIVHLFCNMYVLRQTPNWLETGLGWPLFLATYLLAAVAGNIAFVATATANRGCFGASGAIFGLYGLMFVALAKMGNRKTISRLLRALALPFLIGIIKPGNISNASHIGGFLGGVVTAILFCPSYRDSYIMRRKNSLVVDTAPKDYRQVMGFGVEPTQRGLLPLGWSLLVGAGIGVVAKPRLLQLPITVMKGILHPGSLSDGLRLAV